MKWTCYGNWFFTLNVTAGMIRYYLPNIDISNPLDANRHRFIHYDEAMEKGEAKKIEIDGQMVAFKASAVIPRIYRLKFQRDIYKDLRSLEKSIGDGNEENSNLDLFSLEMFENISYVMAKHADGTIPDTPEEWLDGFNTFSIYQVLPELIELWGLNVQTDVEAKKTSCNRA